MSNINTQAVVKDLDKAMDLRKQALALLQQAQAIDGLNPRNFGKRTGKKIPLATDVGGALGVAQPVRDWGSRQVPANQ